MTAAPAPYRALAALSVASGRATAHNSNPSLALARRIEEIAGSVRARRATVDPALAYAEDLVRHASIPPSLRNLLVATLGLVDPDPAAWDRVVAAEARYVNDQK